MKILVSHPGTQHVKNLLNALFYSKYLVQFFTTFTANKLNVFKSFFPVFIKKRIKTYSVDEKILPFVTSFPFVFLKYKLLKNDYKLYEDFEVKVIENIGKYNFDCFIGYENANLETFKFVKSLNKITILDLAQIHHNDIVNILAPFLSPKHIEFEKNKINPYKEKALEYTDYVFTLSSFSKRSLISNQFPKDRIFEVNLGVDLDLFKKKNQYSKPGRPFQFLFVGTIMIRKGIDLLLRVWDELNLPNATLTMIGSLSDGKYLLSKYEKKITFHPFLPHDELVIQYQEADVFVFPSYLDSWAQTVIEAMACGTPVIVSENTGAKDAVEKGGGFVIPVGNPDELKEKMLYFYNNREEVERIGQKASLIAQYYTWANYHAQVNIALGEIAIREKILK